MKNKNQIIPLAIMLLILTASYSFASSGGLEEGTFPQMTRNSGIASLRPLEEAEESQVICSDKFIVCGDEDDGSIPNNNIGEGDHPLSSSSPIIVTEADDSVIAVKHGGEKVPLSAGSSTSVERQIRQIAEQENFQYTSYLLRLAWCESRYNPKARNDNGKYGMDRGAFQINDRYHPTVSDAQADDIIFATKWTMEKINQGKQHLWSCDKIIKNN